MKHAHIFAVLILIALASPLRTVSASNHFVRPDGATYGSADGSDWSNAWPGFSSIVWSSIAPGDTIWVAGGTYTQDLAPKTSGSSSARVNINRARADAAACTATPGWSATFDATVHQRQSSISMQGNYNYITVSGRTAASGGGHGWWIDLSGLTAGTAIEIWNNANASYNTFEYMDLQGPGYVTYTNDGRGIDATPFSNATGNTFSHMNIWNWESAIYNAGIDGSTFEYLDVFDIAPVNWAQWHPNGIYLNGATNGTVRYSKFHKGPNGFGCGEGIFFEQGGGCSNWLIYGNVFYDLDSVGLKSIELTSNVPGLRVYNNTFDNIILPGVFMNTGGSAGQGSECKNNLSYATNPPDSCGTISNNLTIASSPNPFVNRATHDYHIVSTVAISYPRSAGVDLSSVFTTDMDGSVFGADGAWDIGAYEFSSGSPPPAPPAISTQPANQTVTVGQTATFSVGATGTAPLSYQWQLNGANIFGAINASYTTPAVTAADSGAMFRVVISNLVGSAISSSATLTVNSKLPGITLLTTQSPALLNNSDGVGVNYELGMRFSSSTTGSITAIRFWKDSLESGAHTGRIWDASGVQLTSVAFVNETASGWQEQAIATPLSIAANTEYLVSVNTGNAYYVATNDGFATQVGNGSLSSIVGGNGRYGPAGQYPMQTFQSSNYFRDVRFVASAANAPPVITSSASATPNLALVGQSVAFGVAASDPDGDALTYTWNFGDASSGTGNSASHAYAAAGAYSATATVSDGHGGSIASTVPVTITVNTNSNIAPHGVAYRWFSLTSATGNKNRVAAPGLNDGNLTADVDLSGAGTDALKAYEAAGVVWSSNQTIAKVVFRNGNYTASKDGVFDAGFALQSSADGLTWSTLSGWTLTPAYSYNSPSASGVAYTFTGSAITTRAIRCVGKIHTSATGVNSWYVNARELEAYSSGAAATLEADITATQTATVDLGVFKLNQPLKISLFSPARSNSKSRTTVSIDAQLLPKALHLTRGALTGRPKSAGVFTFQIQTSNAQSTTYKLTVTE
jgi:hypothetical protein